jgi:gamma-glutamyltranspeptidase/glutathione hydrolase
MVAVDVVVLPGTSSLGGTMGVLFHEARTGQTYSLNAGLNTVLDDTEPYDYLTHQQTGRAVLVPGTIAGLEALWKRFGALRWADLWLPAIHFARAGFPLYNAFMQTMERRSGVILRYPEGRAIFAADGSLPQSGSVFCQPLLATTLERLASDGAVYAYQGKWAEQLVAAVQRLGGKMRMEDLARYEVMWQEPTIGSYLDTEVRTISAPHFGGPALLFELNLAEALALHERPRREQSAQTMFDEIQAWKIAIDADTLKLNPKAASAEQQAAIQQSLSKTYAQLVAQRIRTSRPEAPEEPLILGSHQVAAIDAMGNMMTATHSIESDAWGDTGLFVGGISLNSSAFLPNLVQATANPFRVSRQIHTEREPQNTERFYDSLYLENHIEPGQRVAEPLSCYIVLRNQQPCFIAGAVGSGVLGCNFQNTVNIVAHGLDLTSSIAANRWGYFDFDIATMRIGSAVQIEPFDDKLLDAVEVLGQPLARLNRREVGAPYADTGYWTAVGIDVTTNEKVSVTDPRLIGLAFGE